MVEPKLKRFPQFTMAAPVAPLVQSCLGILAINWLCQGMRGMDRKELLFRLLVEGLVIMSLAGLLMRWLSPLIASCTATLMAHSLNFLFNGQFWVCLRYCRFYRNEKQRLNLYLIDLVSAIRGYGWLHEAVVIGSAAFGRVRTERSDIDLRLTMADGLLGWFKTNVLLMQLRFLAFIRAIPLDVYAYDDPVSLRRFDQDEPIWIIKDEGSRLHAFFAEDRMVLL